MSAHSVINITNLSCSYSREEKNRVLFIKNLKLENGKIIFLLGASGTGKSTLLETLGLMNNTIASGTVELIAGENKKYDYAQLWRNEANDEINSIRKNFLSFIFQNTNLMENFTAYENICLSQMIKSNAVQSEAMDSAVRMMRQVRLPETEVSYETLSVNLSGGQRQRVSFVRALNSDYKLLLCDEPTGNLDEVNAHELLNIVKQNLSSDKTAVLVSHDVNLALKYADQIVLITRNTEKGYGEILVENIFQREHWSSMNEHDLITFRFALIDLFLPAKKLLKIEDTNTGVKALKNENSYSHLFLKKEGRVLLGKSYVNLIILTAIISLTFIAIGFANGALKYLNTKIKDPFVNWIALPLPSSKSRTEAVNEILDTLNAPSVKNEFLIGSVTSYKETQLLFFPDTQNLSQFSKGRLLTFDDPLARDLFGKDNFIRGDSSFRNENDFGIVVTLKLLKRLGYPDDAKFIYLDNNDKDIMTNDVTNYKVPLPIRAVIKNIPNRNNFLITKFFYLSYLAHSDCVFDYNFQKKRIIIFTGNDKDLARQLKEDITNNFSQLSDDLTLEDVTIDYDKYDQLTEKGNVLSISFNTASEEAAVTEKFYKKITGLKTFVSNKEKLYRVFDFDIALQQPENILSDYLSISLTSLNKIDEFSKHISKTLNSGAAKQENNIVEVDAGVIKEKNNFNYMSKMTWLISGLLTGFSILSIILFISNLLKTHLNKVKSNLGTYKAFGLSDKESKNIYLLIMLRFILIGIVISIILSYALGKLIEKGFASQLKIEDQSEYFLLFATLTYILLGIIILVTILVSYFNINKILSKTPGDLIYNR